MPSRISDWIRGIFSEDAPHTSGDPGQHVLGVRRDADTSPVDADGDYHSPIFDNAGNLKVNVKITAGGGGGGVSHVDDAAFTAGTDDGVPIFGFADDTAPDSVDEGDAGAVRMSLNRNLYTRIRDNAGNERGLNISAESAAAVAGDVAHDGANAGNPLQLGAVAIAYGANPSEVSASLDRTQLYANRAGVLHVLGGHPNIITIEAAFTTAQADTALVTVGAGAKVVVTRCDVNLDEATTVGVGFRVGFGAATTPTTTGVLNSHPGLVPGGGSYKGDGSGILGAGADNEDIRITSEVPTSGSLRVILSYFTIPS